VSYLSEYTRSFLKSLFFVILALGVLRPLYALQSAAGQDQNAAATDNTDYVATTALPAERIITILQENPDLMAELKNQAVQKAQEQGRIVTTEQITDDMVYRRIEQDPQGRLLITQELVRNGYVDKNDPDLVNKEAGSQESNGNTSAQTTGTSRYGKNSGQGTSQAQKNTRQESQTGGNAARSRTSSSNEYATDKTPAPPYKNMPALRELYVQSLDANTALNRFGLSVFQRLPQTTSGSQMDMPAGPEYVLGPGDGLIVSLWGGTSRRLSVTVDREGRIALPEVGPTFVAGKTLAEVREMIPRILKTQFNNVQSDVSLARLRTVRVYVVGEVQNPGAYDIPSLSTVVNAIGTAGGITPRGSLRRIRHMRGQQVVREFDTYDLLLHGLQMDAGRLEAGDTILVSTVGPQVTVSGMVRRPAIYELKNEQNLKETLDLAGGVLVSGSLQQIRVERVVPHQGRVTLSVDVPLNADKETTSKRLETFLVRDGDKISIAPIPAYSNATIFVDGHVLRPGKYPYRPGLTVHDVIGSYKDLLPEPSDRAEIIRLTPPELKPKVIPFDLRSILDESDPIELQPFDTIRVYGRYQYDAPKVTIYGDVLRPGEYPMSHDMNASDLVTLAGGFKRSAYTSVADLASYSVVNGEKVEIEHRTVDIAKALQGVPDTDVRLKPGDVLSVPQLAGWDDIGGAITIAGEVVHPGTYGVEQGEKLSSVIRRAGGFRPTAYPAGALLERVQVRELDQKSREALIQRVASATPVSKGSGSDQAALASAFYQQQQQILKRLKDAPISGRQVIHIATDISRWENTPADVEVKAGDSIVIPKKPDFVLVDGQVNSPSAITFTPGKSASWYLGKAGGVTTFGDRKRAFVVKADGSVVGQGSNSGLWSGGPLGTVLAPGDSVVIPEKIFTDNSLWRNVLNSAQIVSSVAITARVATSF